MPYNPAFNATENTDIMDIDNNTADSPIIIPDKTTDKNLDNTFDSNDDDYIEEDIYNASPRNKGKDKDIIKNPRINTITSSLKSFINRSSPLNLFTKNNKPNKEPAYKNAKENALNYILKAPEAYLIRENLFSYKLNSVNFNKDRSITLSCTLCKWSCKEKAKRF